MAYITDYHQAPNVYFDEGNPKKKKVAIEERLNVENVYTEYIGQGTSVPSSTIYPSSGTVESSGGSISFAVNVKDGCEVTVTTNDWDIVESITPTAFTGSSEITVVVRPNTGVADKRAVILIEDCKGLQHSYVITSKGKENSFTLVPSAITLTSSSSASSSISFSSTYSKISNISSSCDWVRVLEPWPTGATGNIRYVIDENNNRRTRICSLTVTCGGKSQVVQIVQNGSPESCSIKFNTQASGWNNSYNVLTGLSLSVTPFTLLKTVELEIVPNDILGGEIHMDANGNISPMRFPLNKTGNAKSYILYASSTACSATPLTIIQPSQVKEEILLSSSTSGYQTAVTFEGYPSFSNDTVFPPKFVKLSNLTYDKVNVIPSGWINSATLYADGSLRIMTDKNYSTSARSATIAFSSKNDSSVNAELAIKQGYAYMEISGETSTALPATGGNFEFTVNVTKNGGGEVDLSGITANVSSSWIRILNTDYDENEDTITFYGKVDANTTSSERSYVIMVKGPTDIPTPVSFTVNQAYDSASLSVSPTVQAVPPNGGTYTATVSSRNLNAVSAIPSVSWVRITSFDRRTGVIRYTVDGGHGGESGTITISNDVTSVNISISVQSKREIYFEPNTIHLDWGDMLSNTSVKENETILKPNEYRLNYTQTASWVKVTQFENYIRLEFERNNTPNKRITTLEVYLPSDPTVNDILTIEQNGHVGLRFTQTEVSASSESQYVTLQLETTGITFSDVEIDETSIPNWIVNKPLKIENDGTIKLRLNEYDE